MSHEGQALRITRREAEALALIAEGYSYVEAAGQMCVTPGGVGVLVERAADRNGLTRRQLLIWYGAARARGLVLVAASHRRPG